MIFTSYRVGLPLWRLFAKAGFPMSIKVIVHSDKESGTYWAEGVGLRGLVVTGSDLDELHEECTNAIDELIRLELDGRVPRAIEQRMSFPQGFMAA
jgi:predicted RNase H-like HicB family nuclease